MGFRDPGLIIINISKYFYLSVGKKTTYHCQPFSLPVRYSVWTPQKGDWIAVRQCQIAGTEAAVNVRPGSGKVSKLADINQPI